MPVVEVPFGIEAVPKVAAWEEAAVVEAHDSVPAQLVRVMICPRVGKALILVMFDLVEVVVGMVQALTALGLEAAFVQEAVLVAPAALVGVGAEEQPASEAPELCVWAIPFCY